MDWSLPFCPSLRHKHLSSENERLVQHSLKRRNWSVQSRHRDHPAGFKEPSTASASYGALCSKPDLDRLDDHLASTHRSLQRPDLRVRLTANTYGGANPFFKQISLHPTTLGMDIDRREPRVPADLYRGNVRFPEWDIFTMSRLFAFAQDPTMSAFMIRQNRLLADIERCHMKGRVRPEADIPFCQNYFTNETFGDMVTVCL